MSLAVPPVTNRRSEPQRSLRDVALGLLARREHSVLELHHKLTRRGFAAAEVEIILQELQAKDWLSNSRFAEIYANARADKGYGPLRIRQELRERGVEDDIVSAILLDLEDFWPRKLAQVQRKRFGDILPQDMLARSKQLRFLRHRGFTLEQINELFRDFET